MSEQYYNLIKSWHVKATQDDYFSKFMFEYLAFIAFIHTQRYSNNEIIKKIKIENTRSKKTIATDRDYIQTLKQDEEYKSKWHALLTSNHKAREEMQSLHDYLCVNPLVVNEQRWDNELYRQNPDIYVSRGCLDDIYDYRNVIEFWYTVRNNLFHGTKGPEVERDQKIVKYGFISLSLFVENVLMNSFEKNRMYPFYGHRFFEKFYEGEAEVTDESEGEGCFANIYEIVFLSDEKFPVVIENKTFSREDLIEIINNSLRLSYGSEKFNKIVTLLKNQSTDGSEKYFSDYISLDNPIVC